MTTLKAVVVPLVLAVVLVGAPTGRPSAAPVLFPCGPGVLVRNAPAPADTVEAAFTQRSYVPGDSAELAIKADARQLVVQIFHFGAENTRPRVADTWTGVAVEPSRSVPWARHRARLSLRIGRWPSGLYFARLTAAGRRVGYAPFVLTERISGAQTRIAIVVPTNTWQAYNFRDTNGDGIGDTWYANPKTRVVDLDRSFLHGVPTQERGGFFRWASHAHVKADYFSDDDLDRLSADELIHAFRLIVFAGHEEYVTAHVFDAIRRFRDHGGNLMFLSADNFNFRVTHTGHQIMCDGKFRNYGRQEASLVGVQYVDWNHRVYPSEPYIVTGARAAPWFFAGTGLRNGDRFGVAYGTEIDARTSATPPGTIALARIPNIFGPGRSAEMTYYETADGARVFAAGAMNFQSPQSPQTARLLTNLWRRLSRG